MRAFYAILFLATGLVGITFLIGHFVVHGMPAVIALFWGWVSFAIFTLALYLSPILRHNAVEEPKEVLTARLIAEDLLISVEYEALDAFQVREHEDEGSHYFVKLHDGTVLYMSGQYLYEFEKTKDRPRVFPCTEFALIRHRTEGYLVDFVCRGRVIQPELIGNEYLLEWADIDAPGDGDVFTYRTFEELKQEFVSASAKRRTKRK